MSYLISSYSDVGVQKNVNQDNLFAATAQTQMGELFMAVVCDGMGGLAEGEVASQMLVESFEQWFETILPGLVPFLTPQLVHSGWEQLLQQKNADIRGYGEKKGIRLGTTASALLIVPGQYYCISHVGDSAIYQRQNSWHKLTEDQTLMGREMRRGGITPQQALADPRKSILLQCVGASAVIQPQHLTSSLFAPVSFLLCSDGFYRCFLPEELETLLEGLGPLGEDAATHILQATGEQAKARGETDNISALHIYMTA